jgi:hypothetical protein
MKRDRSPISEDPVVIDPSWECLFARFDRARVLEGLHTIALREFHEVNNSPERTPRNFSEGGPPDANTILGFKFLQLHCEERRSPGAYRLWIQFLLLTGFDWFPSSLGLPEFSVEMWGVHAFAGNDIVRNPPVTSQVIEVVLADFPEALEGGGVKSCECPI